MQRFRFTITVLILCSAAIAAFADAPRFLKVGTALSVDLAKVADAAASSEVIFIGEAHDDALQHRQQMEIIRALYARKLPLAIGVELFPAEGQKQLDEWVQGKTSEEEFRTIYSSYWSYDWKLYRDIFLFARDNRIPMIGMNVSKQLATKVVKTGPDSLTAEDRKELPPQVTWTLNAQQQEYIRRITAQVFRNRAVPPPRGFFQEAQALRNDVFAWNIARFRQKSPKTKVVAITGFWHAIRSGAPECLKKYGSPSTLVVLPQLPEIDPQKVAPEEADFLMPK